MTSETKGGVPHYGKVRRFDDAPMQRMFAGAEHVEIQEKIDGSQFSVSVVDGDLRMRSKGKAVWGGDGGMFHLATQTAQRLFHEGHFTEGETYRFEFLSRPRHNVITYDRAPSGHIILYDIERADMDPHTHAQLLRWGEDARVEVAPLLYSGPLPSAEEIEELLNTQSTLGGSLVEGVVIKARNLRHEQDGKPLKAKVVSDWFKERHGSTRKAGQKGTVDVVASIGSSLATQPRFHKAVQRLTESGQLTGTYADIGPLLKDLGEDAEAEYGEAIKEELFKHFWSRINREASKGFVEWYKALVGSGELVV